MQFVYRCREVMIAQVLGTSTSEGEGCLGTPMAASAEDCLAETAAVLAAQRSADEGGVPIAVDAPA